MSIRSHPNERIPLTDDMIAQIATYVEAGNYLSIACAAIGVHRTTFNHWRHLGERVAARLERTGQDADPDEYPVDILPADVEPYEWQCYKLFWVLETAEAKSEATAVLLIRKQMPQQWTAAMTYLERRFPDRWRKRQTFEQVQIDGGSIDEQKVIEDPEAVELLHDALERIQAGETLELEGDSKIVDGIPQLEAAKLTEGIKKEPQSED